VAYSLEAAEPLNAAVARIMNEQIVRAREHLAGSPGPIDERIHDARKRFKETRALLRLIREPLGEHFDIENAWFRDAGRDLSAARDADAVLEALLNLKLPRGIRSRAKSVLEARRRRGPGDLVPRMANVAEQLVVAQARVSLWPALDDSFETIGSGLQRTYRDGQRAMQHSGMPHELHEWRKRVKEHWYHAQLLRNVYPAMMKTYATTLSDLSRALGDHHDLFALRQIVAQSPREFGRSRAAIALLNAIDTRQRELESEAMEIGQRVYAERPGAWVARMRNYWDAWRK